MTKVTKPMLAAPVVNGASLSGDIITFTTTDGGTIPINISLMPIMANITQMASKISTIETYIATH